MLKRGGLDDDHIVVMHTNDLAGSWSNPHPGQIFNQPGGPDVYEGVPLVRPFKQQVYLICSDFVNYKSPH